jgi:hypothetical protein
MRNMSFALTVDQATGCAADAEVTRIEFELVVFVLPLGGERNA